MTPSSSSTRSITLTEYVGRIAGAWIGQNVAALLGLPFESHLRATTPITGYVEWKDHKNPAAGLVPVKPDAASCDDDTYHELVALRAFERHGLSLTPRQLGEQWIADGAGFHGASHAARQAMLAGHWPPESGHPQFNPHYNTSGAALSSEIYGMIVPGHINLAARLAHTYSHVNGHAEASDASALLAAMVSEAMLDANLLRVICRTMQVLDARSAVRIAVEEILAAYSQDLDWRQAAGQAHERWRRTHPQKHSAVAASAITVLGLLYGQSDFLKTVNFVLGAAARVDVACNPSAAGAVVGALRGLRGIPGRLVEPLNDIYRIRPHRNVSDVKIEPHDERLSDTILRIATLGQKMAVKYGGARLLKHGLEIPNLDPVPQPLESWPAPAAAVE